MTITAEKSILLIIDLQTRLMPAITGGADIVKNADRLLKAAGYLNIPALLTEQSPQSLGPTVPELSISGVDVIHKTAFDACAQPEFTSRIPEDACVIVAGCEAHVCVAQTVMGLIPQTRQVCLVADATGSRTKDNREAAINRLTVRGAEIVTTEMVLFEWLHSAEHPKFKDVLSLVK